MKSKYAQFLFIIFAILIISACSAQPKPQKTKQTQQTIVIGSHGSDVDIWRHIADSDQAKTAKVDIEVKEINDGVALNQALLDGEIDVNAFQSWAYFKEFNDLNHQKLAVLATTYLEPMCLYSQNYKSLTALPDRALIAIPNDVANTARALRLLERAQLITLKPDFNTISGTLESIQSNPKSLQFKLVKGAQLPRVLSEVDLAATGNTIALESGLNVVTDAIFKEEVTDKALENVNILAVRKDRLNDPKFQKLSNLYHQPYVEDYIQKHFGSTKLGIQLDPATLK